MARSRGWHPEDIKAAVRKRGVSLTALAVSHGLRPSACRESLIYPVPRADLVVSEFLGVPLCKLWPDRYDETGRKRPTIVGKRARQRARIVAKLDGRPPVSQRLSAEAV